MLMPLASKSYGSLRLRRILGRTTEETELAIWGAMTTIKQLVKLKPGIIHPVAVKPCMPQKSLLPLGSFSATQKVLPQLLTPLSAASAPSPLVAVVQHHLAELRMQRGDR